MPLDEGEDEEQLKARLLRQEGFSFGDARVVVLRRSLDARKGRPLGFRLEVAIVRAGEGEPAEPTLPPPPFVGDSRRVIVVGAGPAGTFAALRLAQAGARVTIVEMGKPVQPRRHDLAQLTRGRLEPSSNYCFGEGGAGTFSDGKLYTRIKDRNGVRYVLERLVEYGAEPEILVESRPHVGSNRLPKILIALRTALEARGVRYLWGQAVADLLTLQGRVCGVRIASGQELVGDAVILAIGHSARALYHQLFNQGVALEAKSFAVGARLEHPQPLIDRIQYGRSAGHPRLPPSFYQVATQVDAQGGGERGVYSFCMCPGGWIVDSSTEEGLLCTNGMSLSRRDSPFANAALVVSVEPRDYLSDFGGSPLAGIEFQRSIERRAFELGGGDYVAPAQRLVDFRRGRRSESVLASTYRPRIVSSEVRPALPPFVSASLSQALDGFERRLPGFCGSEAQFVGVETRSSSPVRILRDAGLASPSHPGLYPAGEGAGYAGGIVSAALDGVRTADAALARLAG